MSDEDNGGFGGGADSSFGGDTFGGGVGDFGGGQFGSAGGGNSIEGQGGVSDGSGGGSGTGGSGLSSGAFSGGPVGLDASAGPNAGSPSIGQVLGVLSQMASVASALTGQPGWGVAANAVVLSAEAVGISGAALGALLSGDPSMAAAQLEQLGGASN
jgi:hypothetical protein